MELRAERKRFVWEGLRLAQEIRETGVSSYGYSPDAPYTPAARVDAVIADAIAAVAIEKAKHAARVYHFHTDLVGAPLEVTDEAGEVAWAGRYSAWGKVEAGDRQLAAPRTDQPLRYAGQYADDRTGLHYNTFRFYDPDVGRFVNQDPIGLSGGNNLYAYAPNPTRYFDPLSWIHETAPGYHVYGLYEPGATKCYYVGITDDLMRRQVEHAASGRLGIEDEMRPLERNVTYGQSRGYEQAYSSTTKLRPRPLVNRSPRPIVATRLTPLIMRARRGKRADKHILRSIARRRVVNSKVDVNNGFDQVAWVG